MTDLFVFGTLRHVPLLTRVLGRAPEGAEPATLPGHRALAVEGEDFPVLAADPKAQAPGLLLRGLTAAELERIDHYEGGYGYALAPVRAEAASGPVPAQAYVPRSDMPAVAGPWDFDAWAARWGEIATLAAEEAMDNFAAGQPGAPRFARMGRAWARILGRKGAPQTLRSGFTRADVRALVWKPGFDGFFRLRRFTLSHKTFTGGQSPEVSREGFAAFDAALVLPYDPATDRVLLIEQMRYGPLLRDDPTPWMLEPVAGLVDAGEDPVDTARRETAEEARLRLRALEPMLRFYASPGYTSEYFHCFLGLADLSAHDGTLGGLDAENEDIRSHVVTFDRAMALMESGEINAGPLITMLLWLAVNRDRLRAAA